jgi:hypothetical protein
MCLEKIRIANSSVKGGENMKADTANRADSCSACNNDIRHSTEDYMPRHRQNDRQMLL